MNVVDFTDVFILLMELQMLKNKNINEIKYVLASINQSINKTKRTEAMNQSTNETINQWINQPMNQSTNESINQWTNPPIYQSLWTRLDFGNHGSQRMSAGPFYENTKSKMSPLTSWRYFEDWQWLDFENWHGVADLKGLTLTLMY